VVPVDNCERIFVAHLKHNGTGIWPDRTSAQDFAVQVVGLSQYFVDRRLSQELEEAIDISGVSWPTRPLTTKKAARLFQSLAPWRLLVKPVEALEARVHQRAPLQSRVRVAADE